MTVHSNAFAKPKPRHFHGRYESARWRSAYRFAILNAAFFAVFSTVNALYVGVPIEFHVAAAALFAVGSIVAFYLLCESGGSLAAVSFFVLGAGMAFGFGTAYSIYAEGYVFAMFFNEAEQIRNLPIINLMNSISVLIVLVSSWFVARVDGGAQAQYTLRDIFDVLRVLRMPAIVLSFFYFAMFTWTFPVAENLIVRNVIYQLNAMPTLVILISFSSWRSLSIVGKAVALATVGLVIVFGFLEAGKSPVLVAILATTIGLYFGGYRRAALALVAITALLYFAVLASGINGMRSQPRFNASTNTIAERVEMAKDVLGGQAATSVHDEGNSFKRNLTRFLHGPTQSFLVDEWRAGRYGNSLADAWVAVIPRVLWPDKPIVTRFSEELYGKMFRLAPEESTSAQAPTYTAEALWDYGWPGLLVVSVLLGLELGWFTRKWLQFIDGSSLQIGIVLFSVPIAKVAIVVETWIAASYIGGFVTLFILVKSVDLLLLPLLRRRKLKNERLRAARAPI